MTAETAKRNFDILDDLRYARIGSARLSPGGEYAVCDLTRHDLDNDLTTTSLWRIDLANGDARQLTRSSGRDSSPAWSPDGAQIAFLSDRCGAKQVYSCYPSKAGKRASSLISRVASMVRRSGRRTETCIAFTASPHTETRDPTAPLSGDALRLSLRWHRLCG